MNKTVNPKQLDLVEEVTRDQLLKQALPHIDTESKAFKEDLAKIDAIEAEATARKALGLEDFDWANDPSVILHEQRATAVYLNRWNGLVIRQERAWDEEADPFLVITEENCHRLLDRLCDILGVPTVG